MFSCGTSSVFLYFLLPLLHFSCMCSFISFRSAEIFFFTKVAKSCWRYLFLYSMCEHSDHQNISNGSEKPTMFEFYACFFVVHFIIIRHDTVTIRSIELHTNIPIVCWECKLVYAIHRFYNFSQGKFSLHE